MNRSFFVTTATCPSVRSRELAEAPGSLTPARLTRFNGRTKGVGPVGSVIGVHPARTIRHLLPAVAVFFLAMASWAQSPPTEAASRTTNRPVETVVLPKSIPDPLERMNRIFWVFNRELMTDVIKPTSRVYRFLVPKPVRTSISNFGRNLLFPGRLLNHALQGRWAGVGHESKRFLGNTLLGAGGLFDVAADWKVPKSDADFGQTLGHWGWRPDFYLMLPILGPSNDRDVLGLIGDAAANPLTYFSPYSYGSYGISYNNLAGTVDEYVRRSQTETDPYATLQLTAPYLRENEKANFQVTGPQDAASLETLRMIFFTFKNPNFPNRGTTRSVRIPATGKNLKFTFWLQRGSAPVVYIVPGLGSHRLAGPAIALAELVYQHGFSAVCVSSAFNAEFMEEASTAALPGYTPVDGHDLHVALSEIDHQLERDHPGQIAGRALLGYSMGAFHSLYLAATEATAPAPLIHFDRFVAINPPVRLLHAMARLDEFYQAPLEIPNDVRAERIHNTFAKVANLSKATATATPSDSLPFDAVESKFLIGVAFRVVLRDVIFSAEQRHNQGVLKQPLSLFKREPVYQEILQFSYHDYYDRFVTPAYRPQGIDLSTPEALAQASDLRVYAAGLRNHPKVRLSLNRNDFLVDHEDLNWLQTTIPTEQVALFEQGGHLGNLTQPEVQKTIVSALEGLGAVRPKPVGGVKASASPKSR